MNESVMLANYLYNTDYKDIPSPVIEVQKKSLLDALAVTVAAGTIGEDCSKFIEYAIEQGGKPESSIIGFDTKLPAAMAAFANASMAHALDFEDTHDRALVHSNAASVPAALAVAEALGNVSGKELMTALVLGSDIACRMGLALSKDPIEYGFYIPTVLEAFGATAAVCKLLRLAPEQITDAFSLTLCQSTCSAELTQNPQSSIRSVRDAFAARAAVMSGLLAKKGVKGFTQPLEGRAGFYFAYSRGNYEPCRLTDSLGEIFESANISFKPWPTCRGTHPYIEGVLQILKDHKISIGDVERIHVVVSPLNRMLCEPYEGKIRPKSPINAKFSIPFASATALVHGCVNLDHFLMERLQDERVLGIAEKVTYEVDTGLSKEQSLHGTVHIHTSEGIYIKKVTSPSGHPDNPISQNALTEKIINCAKYSVKGITKENLDRWIEDVLDLENMENVNSIINRLYIV